MVRKSHQFRDPERRAEGSTHVDHGIWTELDLVPACLFALARKDRLIDEHARRENGFLACVEGDLRGTTESVRRAQETRESSVRCRISGAKESARNAVRGGGRELTSQ